MKSKSLEFCEDSVAPALLPVNRLTFLYRSCDPTAYRLFMLDFMKLVLNFLVFCTLIQLLIYVAGDVQVG